MGTFDYDTNLAFNRYTNLDGIEWRVISALLDSETKHGNNFWRLLAYNTDDCLFQPPVERGDRLNLIYRDNGLSDNKKVFLSPFVDDAWKEESSRVDIFVSNIDPINHIQSQVIVSVEIMVHNKIMNILGEAEQHSDLTNPSEITEDGAILVYSKSRATTLLKTILAELNGRFIDGIGQLQLNMKMNDKSRVEPRIWNNHAYLGFTINFCTLMSGVSEDSAYGY